MLSWKILDVVLKGWAFEIWKGVILESSCALELWSTPLFKFSCQDIGFAACMEVHGRDAVV